MLSLTDSIEAGADMVLGVLQTLGGLGVFILGMVMMVEGLHAGAGERLQHLLTRFTRSPLSGAVTGTLSTALLQSSSATTIAAIGFVSAGLLSFPQALGIIYGANLGTTVTGWLVVVLGFKLKLGVLLLPLILVGALLRLFAPGRLADLGLALAGFGLIFLGIGQMQLGMTAFEGWVSPQLFPHAEGLGRLYLVLIGLLMTLITQSSSAGVATLLALLNTGNIEFSQAAAVVIGMDLGTSVKALLATLGGRLEARRTGLSHLLFNVVTVFVALLLLDPFIHLWQALVGTAPGDSAELALVAFHSGFNLAAVLLMLPFVGRFAALVEALLPDRRDQRSLNLDPLLLKEPAVAMQAALPDLKWLRDQVSQELEAILCGRGADKVRLRELQQLLDQMHGFLNAIELKPGRQGHWEALAALLHVMDHLQRLHERCDEEPERGAVARTLPELQARVSLLLDYLERPVRAVEELDSAFNYLTLQRDHLRHRIIGRIIEGQVSLEAGTDQLEALRWLTRVIRHQARIDSYLASDAVATISR